MNSPPETASASSRVDREALDHALFCTDRSFDPAELTVYLPPVPRVIAHVREPIHCTVPESLPAPVEDLDRPLTPSPHPDGPTGDTYGSVSDAAGNFDLINLAPGLYEVRQPDTPAPPVETMPPEEAATPEPEPKEPTPEPVLPERRNLRIEVNTGLIVEPGEEVRIGADVLSISGASASLIDVMLLSPPMSGVLLRDGFALTGGDVFTQEDIDKGCISYRLEGDAVEGLDHFSFATPEGEIPSTEVEVRIVVRRRAPRLLGGGRLDRIARGKTASAILDERVDAEGECGLAVTGIAGTGIWAYSLDDGRTWRSVSNIQPALALLLGPGDQLRFAPSPGAPTIARLTYRAWDLTSHEPGDRADLARRSAVGGATAFSLEVTNASLRLESSIALAKCQVSEPWNEPLTGAGLIESGIAIVRLAGLGTWEYNVDGSRWRDCKSAYHGRALLLPADAQFRFVPQPGATGKVSLSLRSWDGDEGERGGHANLTARKSVGDGTAFGATIETWNWTIVGRESAPERSGVEGEGQ